MDVIFELIKKEKKRQQETLMMIPSENYTYPEVRRAVGSILMHKYAEGQPKKRYYQGMEFVDQIELLCEQEALKAFGLDPNVWDVNVQPYSGSPANLEVYNAVLSPGDKIMAMNLYHGGHVSHGWDYKDRKITLASKMYKAQFYNVDEKTLVFDYNQIKTLAQDFKPKLMISGGTAYPREIDYKKMGKIARSVGAYYLADVAHEAGLIAAEANSSPFDHADFVTMTTHKTLRGPRGALIFARKDYIAAIDASVFPAIQGGPHMETIAGITIALQKAQTGKFKIYARQVVKNCQALAQTFSENGFKVVSGGTDKHLALIDLSSKNVSGWHVALALEKAGIIANRSTVPYEKGSPYYPYGLRFGTPALTVRGMKERQMKQIATWMFAVIEHIGERLIPEDPDERNTALKAYKEEIAQDKFYKEIAASVKTFCKKFPVDLK